MEKLEYLKVLIDLCPKVQSYEADQINTRILTVCDSIEKDLGIQRADANG